MSNRSNGHSLFFSPSLSVSCFLSVCLSLPSSSSLSMNYSCDRKTLRMLNWREWNEKKETRREIGACHIRGRAARAGGEEEKTMCHSTCLIIDGKVWMCVMTNRKSSNVRKKDGKWWVLVLLRRHYVMHRATRYPITERQTDGRNSNAPILSDRTINRDGDGKQRRCIIIIDKEHIAPEQTFWSDRAFNVLKGHIDF